MYSSTSPKPLIDRYMTKYWAGVSGKGNIIIPRWQTNKKRKEHLSPRSETNIYHLPPSWPPFSHWSLSLNTPWSYLLPVNKSPPFSAFLPVELTGRRGGRRSQILRRRESLVLYSPLTALLFYFLQLWLWKGVLFAQGFHRACQSSHRGETLSGGTKYSKFEKTRVADLYSLTLPVKVMAIEVIEWRKSVVILRCGSFPSKLDIKNALKSSFSVFHYPYQTSPFSIFGPNGQYF